eukprot:7730-Heterococcus_DN1.PRE.2
MEAELRVESLLYLAHAFKDSGDYERAAQYATMVRALERHSDTSMSMDSDISSNTTFTSPRSRGRGRSALTSPASFILTPRQTPR